MKPEAVRKVWSRRELSGMRATFPMSMMGLMTAVRVLPHAMYHRVMETDDEIPKGAIFEEIVKRCGEPSSYEKTPDKMAQDQPP